MNPTPITARTISDACDSKPLRKFGSAVARHTPVILKLKPIPVRVARLTTLDTGAE